MINKVITSFQDVDDMEEINRITGLNLFNTDNWCDLSEFEEHPELKMYVGDEEFNLLKNKEADYIAFRIDC